MTSYNQILRRSAGGRRFLEDQKRKQFVIKDLDTIRIENWLKDNEVDQEWWGELIEEFYPEIKALADFLENLCPDCLIGEVKTLGRGFQCDYCECAVG